MTAPMTEARLETRFAAACRAGGALVVKLAPTAVGVPDRMVIWPGGRIDLVELKTATGRLSPAQVAWHDRAAARGVTVHVLYGSAEIDAYADAARADE